MALIHQGFINCLLTGKKGLKMVGTSWILKREKSNSISVSLSYKCGELFLTRKFYDIFCKITREDINMLDCLGTLKIRFQSELHKEDRKDWDLLRDRERYSPCLCLSLSLSMQHLNSPTRNGELWTATYRTSCSDFRYSPGRKQCPPCSGIFSASPT